MDNNMSSVKGAAMPTQTAAPTLTTQNAEQQHKVGWFELTKRHKATSNSVTSGALVFLSGGMFMASSFTIGAPLFSNGNMKHMICSWFIGAIIGAVFSAIVTNFIRKKMLILCSAVLVIVSGILAVTLSHDFDGVLASRYLNGIANGICVIVCLVMAGEESVKTLRGFFASSTEVMLFSLGFYLQVVISVSWQDNIQTDFGPAQTCAILTIVYGLLALIMSMFLVVESPVYFLLRNDEQMAVDALRRLERPFVVTNETYIQLEELKKYVAENKEMSMTQSFLVSIPAVLKLCFYRGMNALSSSIFVVMAFITASAIGPRTLVYPFVLYGTFRWLGVLISAFLMDGVGRKKPLLFGLLICAGMAIGVGVIFNDVPKALLNPSKMNAVVGLLVVYQFFAGIYSAASSAYLSEAFPLATKTYNIAFAFIVEMLVHIIINVSKVKQKSLADYFYTVGVLSIVFFVLALLCLPETKKKTLREAQAQFRSLLSKGF